MLPDSPDLFQFASDIDGDLHLFPRNLDEPDYQNRWQVWVILKDGTRSNAPVCSPCMCVNNGVVTNPHDIAGHREVAGWWVDDLGASEIEVSIDGEPPILIPHPRPY